MPATSSKAALFVPCLTGAVFAGDTGAQRRLLASCGFPDVHELPAFCCGQPAATAGDRDGAVRMGRVWAEAAGGFDTVFVASATCCGHLRHEAAGDGRLRYAPDVWMDTIRSQSTAPRIPIYLHRPCHDVWEEDRFAAYAQWVAKTANVDVLPRPFRDPCCGFGGVFSTLFDRTAASMMAHRMGAIAEAGASTVVSAEPGCLSHFAAHAGGMQVVPLASFLVARGVA